MRFFRRKDGPDEPKTVDPGTRAAVDAMREFTHLAAERSVRASYIDVTADFGGLIEARGADILPTSETQLPHQKEVIWSALMVTIALHAPQREHAKAAACVHLQQFVPSADFALYAAALEATRAFIRSISAGPEQGLEAAKYVGDALERIQPLQRQVHRATRRAEFDVAQRFPMFWELPDYFFWRHSHLGDLLGAATSAVAAVRAIRGGDRPQLPDEKEHPQWQVHQRRLLELINLATESDSPLAKLTAEDEERHTHYRNLTGEMVILVARIGSPADDDARLDGIEKYTQLSQALTRINEQEEGAIATAFTSDLGKHGG